MAIFTNKNGSVPYISCNFYHEKDGVKGTNVLDSYKIFDLGGKKVAFVGITTPESFTKSTPKYFQDSNGKYIYGIAGGVDGQALYDSVQAAIDKVKAAGADYVIGLAHLGVDESSRPLDLQGCHRPCHRSGRPPGRPLPLRGGAGAGQG